MFAPIEISLHPGVGMEMGKIVFGLILAFFVVFAQSETVTMTPTPTPNNYLPYNWDLIPSESIDTQAQIMWFGIPAFLSFLASTLLIVFIGYHVVKLWLDRKKTEPESKQLEGYIN